MTRLLAGLLVSIACLGCFERPGAPRAEAESSPSVTAQVPSGTSGSLPTSGLEATEPPLGDADHGRELIATFECNRCHDGTGIEAAPREKHCVHCHQDILGDRIPAAPQTVARWRDAMVNLREVPSLLALGARYRRGWVERFLLEPYDLRPRLAASMPRLPIAPEQARDIAAYLTRGGSTAAPVSLEGASEQRGRAVLEAKGCLSCHAFTGLPRLSDAVASPIRSLSRGETESRSAVALAPDLRHARRRFAAPELVAWLSDPRSIKADTPMPHTPMTRGEVDDLAAVLLNATLDPLPPSPMPVRLPLLSRRVAYEEVNQRVFRATCRHCHAEPDYALGDGGPGSSGGFGFAPRGLDLAHYAGIAAGYREADGSRRSVFLPTSDGTPLLVASMLARQAEEAGSPPGAIRGMPLGLPAFSSEDIQLVESWVAQGRPQ